jgi:hypothetical protein
MKNKINFQLTIKCIFITCLITFAVGCKKGTNEITPKNGTWNGVYPNISASKAIQFNINNGKISASSSTLIYNGTTYSAIVNYYFTNVTITTYIIQDILINNGSFSYSSGSETLIGGLKTITGTFTSANQCTGTVTYDENSSYQTAHVSFSFTANP